MEMACDSFERTMVLLKSNLEWNLSEDEFRRIIGKFDKVFNTLKYRDINGSKIILLKLKEIDLTTSEAMMVPVLRFIGTLLEEETQIAGSVYIIDCEGLILDSLNQLLEGEAYELHIKMSAIGFKIKQTYIVNLSIEISSHYEMAIAFMSNHFVKSLSDLQTTMDT
jgi:hypothetical protein